MSEGRRSNGPESKLNKAPKFSDSASGETQKRCIPALAPLSAISAIRPTRSNYIKSSQDGVAAKLSLNNSYLERRSEGDSSQDR